MDEQTPEEVAAQVDGLAAQCVVALLQGVAAGRWDLCQGVMDGPLRLARAQAFLHGLDYEPGWRDEHAQLLANQHHAHELWDLYEETELRLFTEAGFPDMLTWGVSSRPRPISVDLEVVVLVDTGGEVLMVTEPTLMTAKAFIVRFDPDLGPLIASHNVKYGDSRDLPIPGWPPQLEAP